VTDKPKTQGLTYADAGVDIDAGDALIDKIKPLAKMTARPGADVALGGFGGAFDLRAAGFEDPVLVSGTDGVGTKLRIAIDTGALNTRAPNLYFFWTISRPGIWISSGPSKSLAELLKDAD